MSRHCPCDGCYAPKRKMYCHSHCKEYIEWSAAEKEIKEAEQAKIDATHTNHPNKERAFRKKMRWK